MTIHSNVINSDPEIMGGTPIFRGTRVPIKNLLDYLEAGDSLSVFLEEFPSVTKQNAVSVIKLAREFKDWVTLLIDC
ncbi:MAG: DUF433 domain-containing protein [Cyanobacteria bacterium P01_F01_bin.143]